VIPILFFEKEKSRYRQKKYIIKMKGFDNDKKKGCQEKIRKGLARMLPLRLEQGSHKEIQALLLPQVLP